MNEFEKRNQEAIEIEVGTYQIFLSRYIFEDYLDSRLNLLRVTEKPENIVIRFEFVPENFDLEEGACMLFDVVYIHSKFSHIEFENNDEETFFSETFNHRDFANITINKKRAP